MATHGIALLLMNEPIQQLLDEAEEICAYHTDMMNPALWADVGCEFDREMA